MKNSLSDLNNHLFAQLERLGDEELTQEALEKEINRGKAMTQVSQQILDNARVQLKAHEILGGIKSDDRPALLRIGK